MTLKNISIYIIATFALLISANTAAQTLIFADLNDTALQEALRNSYRPNVVLSYADARDALFSYTATNDHDTLRCVYTGYAIHLPTNQDPSAYAYDNGIDTEHTYPQSKGAENSPAKSDMHHLFPVRSNVNSSRGNDPYAEIPDIETNKWFRHSLATGIMPSTYIDEYSEHDDQTQTFEPREDHKGNAARAVFYFYTMYQQEANAADPAFFGIQKEVLYQWHQQDPADSREQLRNNFIASQQEGKANPFILDPTLVQRAYFPNDTSTTVQPTDTANIDYDTLHLIQYAAPNPSIGDIAIRYLLPDNAQVWIGIFDRQGKMMRQLVNTTQAKGEQTATWDATTDYGSTVAAGLYIAQLTAIINNRTIQEKTLLITIK